MLSVEPGRDGEFRTIRGWLAWSAALDRMIEATEPLDDVAPPPPRPLPAFLYQAYGRRPSPVVRRRTPRLFPALTGRSRSGERA